MANVNTTMTTQFYLDQTLKGFVDYFSNMSMFSMNASPAPAARGQSVVVPFVASGSTAVDWTEAGGYTQQAQTRVGKTVTINKHKYVNTYLTDTEVANSSITNLSQVAYNQGASLAAAVQTDIFTAFTGSNFSSNTTLASASLVSVDSLVDLRAVVSALKWPTVGRNIIMKSTPMKYLLKDDDLKYIYRGENSTVQTAQLRNIFGWEGIWENNLLPTTAQSGTETLAAVAVTPDALLIANRYLAPQDGHKYSMAQAITDPASGLTLGIREWYDEAYGRKNSVIECSYGYTVGNPAGASTLSVTYAT